MYKLQFGVAGVALAVVVASGVAQAKSTTGVRICPSRDKAEQIVQSQGNLVPDDCRMVTVTRVDSPAGPICQIDLGQNGQGVLSSLRDAVTTDHWWTACDNLHAP